MRRWNVNGLYASGNNNNSVVIMCTQMQGSAVIRNGIFSASPDSHAPAVWEAEVDTNVKQLKTKLRVHQEHGKTKDFELNSNVAVFP